MEKLENKTKLHKAEIPPSEPVEITEKTVTTAPTEQPAVPPSHNSFLRASLVFFLCLATAFFFSLYIALLWVNRTLLNTDSVVAITQPQAKNPEVQKAISDKIADSVVKETDPQELARQFNLTLPPGTPPELVQQQAKAAIQQRVAQALASPQFDQVWEKSVRQLHGQGLELIQGNSSEVSINIKDTLSNLDDLLKANQLGFIDASKLDEGKEDEALTFKVDQLDTIRNTYSWYQRLLYVLPAAAVLCAGLAIWLSRAKWRTLCTLAILVGLNAGLFVLFASGLSKIRPDGLDQAAASALRQTLETASGDLRTICGIIFAACVVVAIGALMMHRRSLHPPKPEAVH